MNNFDKEKKIVKLYLSSDFFTLRKPQTGPYFKEVNVKKNYTFTFFYQSVHGCFQSFLLLPLYLLDKETFLSPERRMAPCCTTT